MPPTPDRRSVLWPTLLVAVIAWSAHFLFFRSFGLYEDDYFVVGRQLAWTWPQAWAWLIATVRDLPQGRPIGFLIAHVLPFSCFQLGGIHALPVLYLAASAIVVLNALLAHRLLSIVYGPSFGLLGALVFTLYPADTSHPFLTHLLVMQPSLTLVLLALLAYVRRRRVLAYVLAAGSLLTYESGVLAFFAAPLLSATWEAGIVRRFVRHLAVLLAIVAAVLALRVAVGEGRAANLKGSDQGTRWSHVPAHVLQALWTGPQVSLAAFAKRPVRAAREAADPNVGLGVAAAFAAIFAVLAPAARFAAGVAARRVLLRAGLTGFLMLVGGYAFEFSGYHFPPVYEVGRMTAVHMGATLGAAILVASLLSLPWTAARGRAARLALMALTTLYLASLFGFQLVVQRGFVRVAELQREYWWRIVGLVPDLAADTVVILMGSEPSRDEFIGTSSWADTWVLAFLFHDAAGRSPFLVGGRVPLRRGAPEAGFDESLLEAREGRLWWSSAVPPWVRIDRQAPLPEGKVVVLERRGSGWKRRKGSITFHGVDIVLRPRRRGSILRLVPGPLHDLLLAPAAGHGRAP